MIEHEGVGYNVTAIADSAFYLCRNLLSLEIPNSITTIGSSSFNGCESLASIIIPNSVTDIGNNAFWYSPALTTVSLPVATSIGNNAFQYCTALTTIVLGNESSIATAGIGMFAAAESAIIYVPDALVSGYKTATNWSQYESRIKGISELPTE